MVAIRDKAEGARHAAIRLGEVGGPLAAVFRLPSPRRRDGNLGGRGLCGAFDDEGDAGFNIKCEVSLSSSK